MAEWYVKAKAYTEFRFKVSAETYKDAEESAESFIEDSLGKAVDSWGLSELEVEPFFDDDIE